MDNGNLILPPFRASDYKQEVHAQVSFLLHTSPCPVVHLLQVVVDRIHDLHVDHPQTYRCIAENELGKIQSRDVHVRAGRVNLFFFRNALLTRTRQADVTRLNIDIIGHDLTNWMLHFGERKKIVDIPNGIEHNLTKRWLDWIPNYPERIYRNKTKISHPYWQNINWGTSWCQNPSVKLLRQPVTHVLWIQYAKGWHIISQCERREGLQEQNMWKEEALLTARRETSSFWSFFPHEACSKEICCCKIHFTDIKFSYKWQILGPSSTLRLVWKRWGGTRGGRREII